MRIGLMFYSWREYLTIPANILSKLLAARVVGYCIEISRDTLKFVIIVYYYWTIRSLDKSSVMLKFNSCSVIYLQVMADYQIQNTLTPTNQ